MPSERVRKIASWLVRRLPEEALIELQQRTPGQAAERMQAIERIESLERHVYLYDTLFYKAFAVAGLGDYLEFGVFTGGSLCAAYRAGNEFYRQLAVDKVWGDDGGHGQRLWDRTRFIGFDSFQGLPPVSGPDAEMPVFREGEYAATTQQVRASIARWGADLEKTVLVEGFFEETCTQETAQRLGLTQIAVVHIDSDLYESARTALEFCTPFFRDGSVVIFDEWFQYAASPHHGEQRAFGEWRERHPEWSAAELAREGAGRMAFVLTRVV